MQSVRVNNKRVFAFKSKDQFLDFIEDKKSILIALNAEKLNKEDEDLDSIINKNIGYTDGIGAVFALRRKGINAIKIAGAEFWLDIIARYQRSKTFYFVGSSPEVIKQTISRLKKDYANIQIRGYRDGFLREGDKERLIEDLLIKKPDIVFIAMGSPRQENLMKDLLNAHPALYMGLGGSFDIYSGTKKRAPIFFRKLGLEWLYRLLKEPTRWRRQLTYISFTLKVIFNKL
jgi:UDP-N-acetyl-D-mannosaminouronate:lipid I N-acetyl-D-mannosaminouronosyltransferase